MLNKKMNSIIWLILCKKKAINSKDKYLKNNKINYILFFEF